MTRGPVGARRGMVCGGGEEIPCQARDDGDATWLEGVPAYAGMTREKKRKENMKKLFIIIYALFVGFAYADNVITSKEYVDTQSASLQPQIQAKNTNTVLTYPAAGTETPGEKAIYDAFAAFGEQTDALVTAGQFNNALQVALDTEFVCVSRNDQGCLLYEIRAATQHQSPNVLCEPSHIVHASFDSTTGILTNTDAEPKNYIVLMGHVFDNGSNLLVSPVPTISIRTPQTIVRTFTTPENSHRLFIKHNDTQFDVGAWFPIEPSTTYTLIIRAIETNPSVVGGMKLQLMMVRGEYDSEEFIPCGNVYLPGAN